jgi:hypothetical protein
MCLLETVKKKMNRRASLNSIHFNPSKVCGFSNNNSNNFNNSNNSPLMKSEIRNQTSQNNHVPFQSFSLANFGFKIMDDDIEIQIAKLFNFVVNIQINYGDDFSIANILSKNNSKITAKTDFIYKMEASHDDYCTKKSFYISFFALVCYFIFYYIYIIYYYYYFNT